MKKYLPNLPVRLQRIEDAVDPPCRKGARTYANAMMLEIAPPLEAINNLLYLASNHLSDPEKIRFYLEMADTQLKIVNSIATHVLDIGDAEKTATLKREMVSFPKLEQLKHTWPFLSPKVPGWSKAERSAWKRHLSSQTPHVSPC